MINMIAKDKSTGLFLVKIFGPVFETNTFVMYNKKKYQKKN